MNPGGEDADFFVLEKRPEPCRLFPWYHLSVVKRLDTSRQQPRRHASGRGQTRHPVRTVEAPAAMGVATRAPGLPLKGLALRFRMSFPSRLFPDNLAAGSVVKKSDTSLLTTRSQVRLLPAERL